ncbi:MAG: hypothetical protein M3Q71_05100 [Chloroflexota bacterium]|nr:hypothetical protein [Chloroflexota bacterium]
MQPRPDAGITTTQFLARLQARGLAVTANMLAQDVKAGYLPSPAMQPRGRRSGIGRLWSAAASERGVYLYRLRRRGVTGDLLRVLLFLHDGWGWERVRPVCEAGLRKVLHTQASPVKRRLRTMTPTNLDFLIGEVTEGVVQSEEFARFAWGTGFFGAALPGGSLQPFLDSFQTVYGLSVPEGTSEEAERRIQELGLTYERFLTLVRTADDAQAERARQRFWLTMGWFRRLQQVRLMADGERSYSSNPLTFFGRSRKEVQAMGRSLPGRPTPAQLLGAWFALSLVEFAGVETAEMMGEVTNPT